MFPFATSQSDDTDNIWRYGNLKTYALAISILETCLTCRKPELFANTELILWLSGLILTTIFSVTLWIEDFLIRCQVKLSLEAEVSTKVKLHLIA